VYSLIIQINLAGIRLMHACDHFHQRRFASAIFPQQRMDFTGRSSKCTLRKAWTPAKLLLTFVNRKMFSLIYAFSLSRHSPDKCMFYIYRWRTRSPRKMLSASGISFSPYRSGS